MQPFPPATGLTKAAAFRGGQRDVAVDERLAVALGIQGASVADILRLAYPALYALHDPSRGTPSAHKFSSPSHAIRSSCGLRQHVLPRRAHPPHSARPQPWQPQITVLLCDGRTCPSPAANWGAKDDEGRFVLPAGVPLEMGQLSADGAYLLDNGRIFLLWLGHAVTRDFVVQVSTLSVPSTARLVSQHEALKRAAADGPADVWPAARRLLHLPVAVSMRFIVWVPPQLLPFVSSEEGSWLPPAPSAMNEEACHPLSPSPDLRDGHTGNRRLQAPSKATCRS